MALAEVAGADLDRPPRQPQRVDRALRPRRPCRRAGPGACSGVGDGQDLDLVELVGAQHAPRVAAGRAGLAPVARRRRHHPHRQVGLVEDLVAVHRRQRDLRRGMHHRSSRSMAKASSANFGSCPLAVSVAVVTSDGGRISSKASALRSRANWHSARPSVGAGTAGHHEHRAADLDRPLDVEDPERRRPSPSAGPVGGRRTTSGRRCGPLTTGLSASDAPSGTSGWMTFGITSSSPRSAADDARRARRPAAARPRRAGGSRPAAASASATLPSRRSAPTCLDSSLTRARVSSRCAVRSRSRASSSAASSSWSSSAGSPRRGRRLAHPLGVVAQQPDVDHGGGSYRSSLAVRARWSAGWRANSCATSS